MKWSELLQSLSVSDFTDLSVAILLESQRRQKEDYVTEEEKQMAPIPAIKSIRSRLGCSLMFAKRYYEKATGTTFTVSG